MLMCFVKCENQILTHVSPGGLVSHNRNNIWLRLEAKFYRHLGITLLQFFLPSALNNTVYENWSVLSMV